MESWFKFKERSTSIRTELLAGITTFFTMVYIVIVNPGILSQAGMDFNGVFVATVLASIIGTLIMGLLDAIPASLKHAITAGIGLFITFIGLQNSGIIVSSPATLLTLGSLVEPQAILTIVGLIITLILMAYRVKGYLFIGMLITGIIAGVSGLLKLPEKLVALPSGLSSTFFRMDIGGVFANGLYAIIFTFLLITLFDTTGTMLGVAEQAGLVKGGKFPRARGALLADAIGTTTGAVMGTSPTSAFIESSAGVAVGGRTGLTAVTASILLGLTLFFSPVIAVLATFPAITAPVLIIVGFLMINVVSKIDWSDFEIAFPAFLIIVILPFSYSIATGIGVGFITYPILKAVRGKWREVHPIFYLFAVLFFIQLAFFGH